MNIIFHIPIQLDRNLASASQIRPLLLIEAFRRCGYQVDVVEGFGAQRKQQIAQIKRKIRQGVKYQFLYSENSTVPTLLTEPHHLPTYPCLDFSFFAFCKRHGIPIGLFYRDIYWQFIAKNSDLKQRMARPFYFYDLMRYRQLVDVLFLPTQRMLSYIPFKFSGRAVELPSGCDFMPLLHKTQEHSVLEIFYVGGITGDYDMRIFVQAVAETPQVHLTLCCREQDWKQVVRDYQPFLNDHITIVHHRGAELEEHYAAADCFAMLFNPSEYRKFAAPFKLFEAIGHGMPILATADTWVGDYVEKHGVGMTCAMQLDVIKWRLAEMVKNPERMALFAERARQLAPENTWEARCHQIAEALMSPLSSCTNNAN